MSSVNKVVEKFTFVFLCFSIIGLVNADFTCLSCSSATLPTECAKVERCGPHEACVIEIYINHIGSIRYNLGCRDQRQCVAINGKRNIVSQNLDPYTEELEDTTVCSECCTGDLCNSAGCHKSGFVSKDQRGPICYSCADQHTSTDCGTIKICSSDEICMLSYKEPKPGELSAYESKCEKPDVCESVYMSYSSLTLAVIGKRSLPHMFTDGGECKVQCCDTDLCNGGQFCSSGSTPSSTQAPSQATHPSTQVHIETTSAMKTNPSTQSTQGMSSSIPSSPVQHTSMPLSTTTTAATATTTQPLPLYACLSNPCQNGVCIEVNTTYYCHCNNGYYGRDCEHAVGGMIQTTSQSAITASVTTIATAAITQGASTTSVSTTGMTGFQFTSSVAGTVQDHRINAIGLAASRTHPGFLYVLNEGHVGHGPHDHGGGTVSVIDGHGNVVATIDVHGIDHFDWEDIEVGHCPGHGQSTNCVYILNGIQAEPHAGKELIYFPEPSEIKDQPVDVHHENIIHLEMAENCGAIFENPAGDVFLICRDKQILRVQQNQLTSQHPVVDHLGYVNMTGVPVAADLSSDGQQVLIKTLANVYYWNTGGSTNYGEVLKSAPTTVASYHAEHDGQSITFDSTGQKFYTLSKDHNQPLHVFNISRFGGQNSGSSGCSAPTCKFGTCTISTGGGMVCQCHSGYTGSACDLTTVTSATTVTSIASTTSTGSTGSQFASSTVSGTVTDARINALGLAASLTHPGYLYVLNEGGHVEPGHEPGHGPGHGHPPPAGTVSVIDSHGTTVATFEIHGVDHPDWEDISTGPCPGPDQSKHCIFVVNGISADPHAEKHVFYFPEPVDLRDGPIDVPHEQHIPLGIREDCGSIFVDPNGDIYLVCADRQLLKIPHDQIGSAHPAVQVLGSVNMSGIPVAADMSSDGKQILIKTLSNVYYWNTGGAASYADVLSRPATTVTAYKAESNGQSIAWDNNGQTFYTLSKGSFQPLYEYS